MSSTKFYTFCSENYGVDQGLKFECGATNPVAMEECFHKHAPARGIWGLPMHYLWEILDALGLLLSPFQGQNWH